MRRNRMKYVPDSSVLINGQFLKYLSKQSDVSSIILSRVVLAEIENMANQAKATGMVALEEFKLIKDFCAKNGVEIIIDGSRPTVYQIRDAPGGELDAKIRELAEEYQAVLVTSDRIQAEMGEVEMIAVVYLKEPLMSIGKRIEQYFDERTMSIHLRENNPPLAKKGVPGTFKLVRITEEGLLTRESLEELAKDIVERVGRERDAFIESDRQGTTVVQLNNIRIVILRPPFSDAMEITAVRPIIKRVIKDYKLDSKLLERIEKKADGIIIAGAPGAGKSTFATALAEFYADKERIVKTFENPRDLQVDERITQMSGFEGDISASADLVLLMRPDYVIYDELRRTKDFETYADLRLSGIGLIGVVHATQAIDGIQRFIRRVDLGVIPSIVDTIIFIENGEITKTYTLSLQVKVPTGMLEKDLARPVVDVSDFHNNRLEYEIYSFGEQIVVSPVHKLAKSSSFEPKVKITRTLMKKILKRYSITDFDYMYEPPNNLSLYVNDNDRPKVLGREGKRIHEIEDALGIRIDVRTFDELGTITSKDSAEFVIDTYETKNGVHLTFPIVCIGKDVIVTVNGQPIVQLTVGKSAEIKLAKNTETGKLILEARKKSDTITAVL